MVQTASVGSKMKDIFRRIGIREDVSPRSQVQTLRLSILFFSSYHIHPRHQLVIDDSDDVYKLHATAAYDASGRGPLVALVAISAEHGRRR